MLVVEDDVRRAAVLVAALLGWGHQVAHAPSVRAALTAAAYDLVLLNPDMPTGDGCLVYRHVRQLSDVPIIIMTPPTGHLARKARLRHPADHYLVKPFGLARLRTCVQQAIRRSGGASSRPRTIGRLSIAPDDCVVTVDGNQVSLSRKELQLLCLLAREPGAVVPRNDIVAQLWGSFRTSTFRTMEVHISSLRAKIRDAVAIQSIRGVGYRLVPIGKVQEAGK